jgi:hypothetical protein
MSKDSADDSEVIFFEQSGSVTVTTTASSATAASNIVPEKVSFLSKIAAGAKKVVAAATESFNKVAKCTQEDLDMDMLGITQEDREAIWKRFAQLVEQGGGEGDKGAEGFSTDSRSSTSCTITAPTFVSECVQLGQSAKFGDATFRTLDQVLSSTHASDEIAPSGLTRNQCLPSSQENRGGINRHQYLIGYWIVTKCEIASKNAKWFEWRRKIICTYYNKSLSKEGLSYSDFCDYLDDLGKSNSPELFGVKTNWEEIIEEKVRLLGSKR